MGIVNIPSSRGTTAYFRGRRRIRMPATSSKTATSGWICDPATPPPKRRRSVSMGQADRAMRRFRGGVPPEKCLIVQRMSLSGISVQTASLATRTSGRHQRLIQQMLVGRGHKTGGRIGWRRSHELVSAGVPRAARWPVSRHSYRAGQRCSRKRTAIRGISFKWCPDGRDEAGEVSPRANRGTDRRCRRVSIGLQTGVALSVSLSRGLHDVQRSRIAPHAGRDWIAVRAVLRGSTDLVGSRVDEMVVFYVQRGQRQSARTGNDANANSAVALHPIIINVNHTRSPRKTLRRTRPSSRSCCWPTTC